MANLNYTAGLCFSASLAIIDHRPWSNPATMVDVPSDIINAGPPASLGRQTARLTSIAATVQVCRKRHDKLQRPARSADSMMAPKKCSMQTVC